MNTPIIPPLQALRRDIDQLDSQLLQLLAQRQMLVRQVAEHKSHLDAIPAYDRLLPMLQSRAEQAKQLNLDPDFIARLFQQIAHQAMRLQRQQLAPTRDAKCASSLPLVYSCSGCSSAAQLANDLALALDREQRAEMSCIAGVGGNVDNLLKIAHSGRPILAIDGCALKCTQKCLQRHGIEPEQHVVLSELGVRKRRHRDYSAEELLLMKKQLIAVVDALHTPAKAAMESQQ